MSTSSCPKVMGLRANAPEHLFRRCLDSLLYRDTSLCRTPEALANFSWVHLQPQHYKPQHPWISPLRHARLLHALVCPIPPWSFFESCPQANDGSGGALSKESPCAPPSGSSSSSPWHSPCRRAPLPRRELSLSRINPTPRSSSMSSRVSSLASGARSAATSIRMASAAKLRARSPTSAATSTRTAPVGISAGHARFLPLSLGGGAELLTFSSSPIAEVVRRVEME